jgi:3-isopropylmalate dehydrogenase
MLLRESFGQLQEAQLIEDAVADVWRQGWRTADLAEPGCRITETKEIGEIIAKTVIKLSNFADVK